MSLNTISGGADTSFSTKLNNNFQLSVVRANSGSEDTGEYSGTVGRRGSWTGLGYSKTFTCPAGTNNKIKFIKIVADIKASSGDNIAFLFNLTNNTNSEVVSLVNSCAVYINGSTYTPIYISTGTTSTTYETKTLYFLPYSFSAATEANTGDDANSIASATLDSAAVGGETYTLTIYAVNLNDDETNTAYITNITPTIYWEFVQDAEVSGWA